MVGDATQPHNEPYVDGAQIVAHICNDIGRWGKGFVLALSKRWPEPETVFKQAFLHKENCALGDVQFVPVTPQITIANMVAQHGIVVKGQIAAPPIRYEALEIALAKVAGAALERNATVHMPRIGCGLAGGRWEIIEPIIEKQLVARYVAVVVYDMA